jgi:hypothetical protein
LSFENDRDTGLYGENSNVMGVTTAGARRQTWASNGSSIFVPFWQADGAVGAPSYSFDSDTDCGIYRLGANNLALSIGGTKTMDFGPNTQVTSGCFQVADGSAASPTLSFINDNNTGIFGNASDTLRFSVGGTERCVFDTTNANWSISLIPTADNAKSLGVTGNRWSVVWAANGTIQTSLIESKTNVEEIYPEDPIECKVPMPALFTRPGEDSSEKRLGWLADSLPLESHPVIKDAEGNTLRNEDGTPKRDMANVYTDAVLAMHSLALRNDYERLQALEARLTQLEAAR